MLWCVMLAYNAQLAVPFVCETCGFVLMLFFAGSDEWTFKLKVIELCIHCIIM